MTQEQLQQWRIPANRGMLSHLCTDEIMLLHDLAANKGLPYGHILEVGMFLGGTTQGLAQANQLRGRHEERVYTCDPYPADTFASAGQLLMGLTACRSQPGISFFHGDIRDLAMLLPEGTTPFRLAFIDGEHSFIALCRDMQTVAPLVTPEGRIVVHDVNQPGNSTLEGCNEAWRLIAEPGIPVAGGKWIPEQPGFVGSSGVLRFTGGST